MNSALLSSKKMDYCTPQGFFDTLNAEFHFTLDAAATEKSAKCKNFYTPETDGLTAPWNIGGGQRVLQPAVWPGTGRVGAQTVVKALDALERKLGARRFRAIFKSITFDNGTEFAAAEELERSCINKHLPRTKVYFCHPYSSWERGTNENTNGMIRRRFPKGTNFAAVTNAQIVQAENWINNYPRKILGYKSSEIVFRECLRELGIAA